MAYGWENNLQGKSAELLIKKLLESQGYECRKGTKKLETDLVCIKNGLTLFVEVKSRQDSTQIKFKRWIQLTSKSQEKTLAEIFSGDRQFKLFIVSYPSKSVEEYSKEELALKVYPTRLGYLQIKKTIRNMKH